TTDGSVDGRQATAWTDACAETLDKEEELGHPTPPLYGSTLLPSLPRDLNCYAVTHSSCELLAVCELGCRYFLPFSNSGPFSCAGTLHSGTKK
ncbi:hypothetical protein J6590_095212, partial [Homalodisca vitripennis]